MIVIETQEMEDYLKEVEDFARSVGMLEQFHEQYDYLDKYADYEKENGVDIRCRLYKDFAPYSFAFNMERREKGEEKWKFWFNGGLIFHGDHDRGGDGGAPTFSCNLIPQHGWSVHT